MGNADSVSAVFGLLLGLVAHHPPVVATATAATSGPAVAIEKAQSAATAESRRARESDAEAARVFSPTSDAAPVASAAKSNAVTAAEASKATAPADASAATVPAEASDAVVPADASKTAASTAADAQLAANGSEDTYDPSRHRDPFRPPPNVVADKAVARTPLEAYEIGQL